MSTQVSIPGYAAGTWAIDAARSDVSFRARLLGFARVRGTFPEVEGTISLAEDPLDSSVAAVVRTASVTTANKRRDDHLRHDDFLNAEQYPTMSFASTAVRPEGDDFLVDGDLTIRATTKPVTLRLKPTGFAPGADGRQAATFSATTEIVCTDFGVTRGKSAFAVGDKVEIVLTVEAGQQA
ncbi:YceI family protein [Actinacidiphila yeochonensis]|uniref:YceI family protein n=1 Tax=Actinacidiphila yeochonensis TaxID=89050 RepID=UPI00055AABA6|nr:YceI family protein [Actinacidiphila yeochonensis]